MKRDLGSRTFTEMYLITKEDKNLLDKCITNLNQNSLEKSVSSPTKTHEKETQTSNADNNNDLFVPFLPDSSDESGHNTTISKDTIHLATPSKLSPKREKLSNQSEESVVDKEENIEKSKKHGLSRKKIRKPKTPDLQFGLVPTLYSPVSTRSKKKKKSSSDYKLQKSSTQYNK